MWVIFQQLESSGFRRTQANGGVGIPKPSKGYLQKHTHISAAILAQGFGSGVDGATLLATHMRVAIPVVPPIEP